MQNLPTNGYLLKIGNVEIGFDDIRKGGYEVFSELVMTLSADRLASGRLDVKDAPHKPPTIKLNLMPLTPNRFRQIRNALRNTRNMPNAIEFWDDAFNMYRIWTFYHTDLGQNAQYYTDRVEVPSFRLIGH